MNRVNNCYSRLLPEIVMMLLVPIAVLYPIYQLFRLLILGEKWTKTKAESCRLNHSQLLYQVEAIKKQASPSLKKKLPSIYTFSVSDAISLFKAVSELLVFLSILTITTRFAEKILHCPMQFHYLQPL